MATTIPGWTASGRHGVRRSGATFLLMAVTALSSTMVAASPARAGGAPATTALVATHSDKLLDVRGASHAPGADLVQWPFTDGDNQRWAYLPFSTIGGLDLVVIQSVESGLVLDVAGSSTGNGASIVQAPWSGAPSQLWIMFPLSNGSPFHVVVNVNSGRVLDIAGASLADGAPAIQWNWHGGTNQIWKKVVFTVTNP